MRKLKFEIHVQEADLITQALGELPYKLEAIEFSGKPFFLKAPRCAITGLEKDFEPIVVFLIPVHET